MTTIAMHTMKAQDLRVGNWVEFIDFPAKYFTKVTPKILSIINDYPKNHTWFSVPLTPEIVEKCGFDKEEVTADHGAIWRNNGFHIASHHSYKGFRLLGFHNKSVPILYLHQLQNLFFALTGEELEVNL
jgi:hypothetical protein